MSEVLKAKDISFAYHQKEVIRHLSLEIRKGEIVFIIGPNGSGKTTLLKCLGRLLEPRGVVYVDSINIKELKPKEVAKLFGYVPQRSDLPPLTVIDAILMGRIPYIGWSPSKKDMEVVHKIIEKLNLSELGGKMLTELSGGELQKVIIARALAQEPRILLLDEPVNNLDLRHQLEFLDMITATAKTREVSVLMTTHDLNLSARFSDTIVMLKEGKVFSLGSPSQVITAENIREVYGVEVIIRKENDHLFIQPLRCINRG